MIVFRADAPAPTAAATGAAVAVDGPDAPAHRPEERTGRLRHLAGRE